MNIPSLYKLIVSQQRCGYCSEPYYPDSSCTFGLCQECSKQLKPAFNFCPRCGFFPYTPDVPCSNCAHKTILWSKLKVFGPYEGILQQLIIQGKFHEKLILTQSLGTLLIPLAFSLPKADFLLPMPLHPKRLVKRGYNQVAEIAKPIGKALHMPILHHALKRNKYTAPQSSLHKTQRLTNLTNAFQGERKLISQKKILLLDDVSTTGSTLQAATKALLEEGAAEVYVLLAASTPLKTQ